MDLQLKNKTALVTGSTAGIGFAIARRLAAEGAAVVINGRTQKRVDEALTTLRAAVKDANVRGIVADLGAAAGCEALIKAVPNVDILVNNVGIFEPKPFTDIPDEDWMRLFEVNVMSGVRLTRHYLAGMKDRDWGRIIFIASESAVQIPEEMVHYGMTKTAQVAIARGVANTTRRTGVTVNSILVGPTDSEGVGTFVKQMADQQNITPAEMEKRFFQTARPTSLLGRFINVDEVANLVAYTASPLASATNGAALRVDGGVIQAIL
ncbi:MAG: SDR family NAD(P)-dependent oxidoreductase [Planctomycetes bacterium]|nr:SDR family NAD(P)-dependent oxidoreductase [Planctomycetota bacterium]